MDPSMLQQSGVQGVKYNMLAMTKLFDSMSKSCFSKCISRFNQPDLAVGEATCVDRCTLKFIQTAQLVTEEMQKAHETEIKQQQALQQMNQGFGGMGRQ
eukprot:CAMPEP_0114525282 /NCGR_PEP_ID=MMETSP0109-20121206/22331_1 /TAXON_ID=29199 /ORGANISM="Chlorarachnion reptans, Strain CCCM449" /LENGTH=98 /DNA_ID=CAMNT_0001706833 /DNA_START=44 /DNA_END=340 /DNA_ORIENTATION=+